MFGMGIDRKNMMIIIVIFAMFNILTRESGLETALFRMPALLIAITFHEFAHAYAAYKLGDRTPKQQGRVTLNPLKHLDPIGTVLILTAGFGWGKPVEINPRNFDHKVSMSKGEAIVSVAGPLTNFIIAFLFLIALYLMHTMEVFVGPEEWRTMLFRIMGSCVMINIGLGVFNLIPLPPLDGSKILMHFLPYDGKQWFVRHEQIFFIVFIVLWMTGMAGEIIVPMLEAVFSGMDWLISIPFGGSMFFR